MKVSLPKGKKRVAKLQAKDVYVVRREASPHPVPKETLDLLRATGASEYTLKAASKVARSSNGAGRKV